MSADRILRIKRAMLMEQGIVIQPKKVEKKK